MFADDALDFLHREALVLRFTGLKCLVDCFIVSTGIRRGRTANWLVRYPALCASETGNEKAADIGRTGEFNGFDENYRSFSG